MALWLCRAGRIGEYETKFLESKAIYCTWEGLDWDMATITEWEDFRQKVRETYPKDSAQKQSHSTGQLYSFAHRMSEGDLVVLPSKIKPSIHVGKILSGYKFTPGDEPLFAHNRSVKWLKEIPRTEFDQDILYSLGAFMTICRIERNNAENRVQTMLSAQTPSVSAVQSHPIDDVADELVDIEQAALQEISETIVAKYKGHGMADIIAAILEAKGYTTFVSPPGPDKGVDILASQGALGFDSPRICVQVKSGDTPLERNTLDQLIGAMSNHKADYGMLVSWSGFKQSITREEAGQFFKVRLWSHKEVVQEFLRHYEDFPEKIREAIPLKRIWIIDKYA